MLQRALFSALCVFALVLALLGGRAFATEANCPAQLADAQTQVLVVAQSRDQTEQRLAQAIRANRELSQTLDRLNAQHKKLADDLKALQEKPADSPKVEAPKPQ